MKRILVIAALALAAAALAGPASGQGAEACPDLVTDALRSLDSVCAGLERDAACYGYNRVDAIFWTPQTQARFSQPADRAALIDLQTIATAPLDLAANRWGLVLLNVQADVPETLPGQAVTFLLMGDVTLQNAVPPEQAAAAVVPVRGVTTTASNIRSRPTTAANILLSVPAGTPLTLTGVSEGRDWYELLMSDGGRGWIFGQLVRVSDRDALSRLPVGSGPRYGPMQAFYFTTGLGGPVCAQAPNALIIQSTELAEVRLNVNELEIRLGSTIALTTALTNDGMGRALVITLLEGRLQTRIGGYPVTLTRPGQAIAVSLNSAGRVDSNSRLLRLRDPGVGQQVAAACQFAALSSLFGRPIPASACIPTLTYYVPPPPPTPVPATPTPVGPYINFVADRTTINLRECVTLSWAVENVREVYYQGQGVTGQGSRQECPPYNMTYTLTVVLQNGERVSRSIPITVLGGYTISFTADRTNIKLGECVTLSWATEGVREVYYQEQGVVGYGSRQECPSVYPPADVSYTLRVVLVNGESTTRTVTVRVN